MMCKNYDCRESFEANNQNATLASIYFHCIDDVAIFVISSSFSFAPFFFCFFFCVVCLYVMLWVAVDNANRLLHVIEIAFAERLRFNMKYNTSPIMKAKNY